MKIKFISLIVAALLFAVAASAQSTSPSAGSTTPTDPGVRNGSTDSGDPLADLSKTPGATEFFSNGLARFQETHVVQNAASGQHNGLGPRFNFDACVGCHSQPAVGGSGPNINIYPFVGQNPESLVITDNIVNGNTNSIPSFVTANGPVREARFPFVITSNGTVDKSLPDGGVHDLFTISGRSDAGNCSIPQPDFTQAENLNDIIFRIPTPVFGAGFIENIGEDKLLKNCGSQSGNSLGISCAFNHSNDGTITRFGWKAQNKSMLVFAGEASNVELGVTNEMFTNERPNPDEERNLTGLPNSSANNCLINPTPEDITNFKVATNSDQAAQNAQVPGDIVMLAMFMRLLDQPAEQPNGYTTATKTVTAASISRGASGFSSAGCSVCHNPAFTTDHSSINVDLDEKKANAFSDFEIHHMGAGLADNVSQGNAGGDQFRTAPLWGIGQRIFLLHDGRTMDLYAAIQAHSSTGSEADTVISNFNTLPQQSTCTTTTDSTGTTTTTCTVSQQDVLNFVRSL
jgi:CxxC motif-containing protein (DUF1111 family)